jgi:hypothetical protein
MTSRSPFGTDVSTFVGGRPGLDPQWTTISGDRVVVENVARRWLTPKGFFDDDPDFGEDVREYLQARQNSLTRARARMRLRAQALLEERVADCTVTVDSVGETLKIRGVVKVKQGKTFALTMTLEQFKQPEVQIREAA